jgi:hypothetical protein
MDERVELTIEIDDWPSSRRRSDWDWGCACVWDDRSREGVVGGQQERGCERLQIFLKNNN